jgi:hypothetical protein
MPLSWNEIKSRAVISGKKYQQLDSSFDLCFRPQPFLNETKRIEYLFELYDRYTAGLFTKEKKKKPQKK